MTEDARFEDAAGSAPLRLRALDADDLRVVSALLQDAVTETGAMRWKMGQRRFACLLNRFRWEDAARAEGRGDFERVRSVLVIEDVLAVRSQGLQPGDPAVTALLTLAFEAGEDGGGRVILTFAGDALIEVTVEALEATLTDVTRPYRAPSGRAPQHEV